MRITIDARRPLVDEPASGHNRWHSGIGPIATVSPGEIVTIEVRDGFDGQLERSSSDGDVAALALGRSHPLTGPIAVEGVEAGELLEVELLGYEISDFGFTVIVPGVGLLADEYPGPRFIPWLIEDERARSPALPGVSIPVQPFAGILGVAPSSSFMRDTVAREGQLARTGALVPEPDPVDAVPRGAGDGLRTIPPRENGGNLDIPQLVAGSRLLLPVQRAGGLLSVGDLHAAQGEGECCGSALEVSGAVRLRLSSHSGSRWRPRLPAFLVPERPGRPAFATTGIPLTDAGESAPMDLNLAARRALLEMIDFLVDLLSVEPQDAYALCSVAVDLRISEAVDAPNSLVSALLPLDVLDPPQRRNVPVS